MSGLALDLLVQCVHEGDQLLMIGIDLGDANAEIGAPVRCRHQYVSLAAIERINAQNAKPKLQEPP